MNSVAFCKDASLNCSENNFKGKQAQRQKLQNLSIYKGEADNLKRGKKLMRFRRWQSEDYFVEIGKEVLRLAGERFKQIEMQLQGEVKVKGRWALYNWAIEFESLMQWSIMETQKNINGSQFTISHNNTAPPAVNLLQIPPQYINSIPSLITKANNILNNNNSQFPNRCIQFLLRQLQTSEFYGIQLLLKLLKVNEFYKRMAEFELVVGRFEQQFCYGNQWGSVGNSRNNHHHHHSTKIPHDSKPTHKQQPTPNYSSLFYSRNKHHLQQIQKQIQHLIESYQLTILMEQQEKNNNWYEIQLAIKLIRQEIYNKQDKLNERQKEKQFEFVIVNSGLGDVVDKISKIREKDKDKNSKINVRRDSKLVKVSELLRLFDDIVDEATDIVENRKTLKLNQNIQGTFQTQGIQNQEIMGFNNLRISQLRQEVNSNDYDQLNFQEKKHQHYQVRQDCLRKDQLELKLDDQDYYKKSSNPRIEEEKTVKIINISKNNNYGTLGFSTTFEVNTRSNSSNLSVTKNMDNNINPNANANDLNLDINRQRSLLEILQDQKTIRENLSMLSLNATKKQKKIKKMIRKRQLYKFQCLNGKIVLSNSSNFSPKNNNNDNNKFKEEIRPNMRHKQTICDRIIKDRIGICEQEQRENRQHNQNYPEDIQEEQYNNLNRQEKQDVNEGHESGVHDIRNKYKQQRLRQLQERNKKLKNNQHSQLNYPQKPIRNNQQTDQNNIDVKLLQLESQKQKQHHQLKQQQKEHSNLLKLNQQENNNNDNHLFMTPVRNYQQYKNSPFQQQQQISPIQQQQHRNNNHNIFNPNKHITQPIGQRLANVHNNMNKDIINSPINSKHNIEQCKLNQHIQPSIKKHMPTQMDNSNEKTINFKESYKLINNNKFAPFSKSNNTSISRFNPKMTFIRKSTKNNNKTHLNYRHHLHGNISRPNLHIDYYKKLQEASRFAAEYDEDDGQEFVVNDTPPKYKKVKVINQ